MIVVVALLLLVTLAMWAVAIRAILQLLEARDQVLRLEDELVRLEELDRLTWGPPS